MDEILEELARQLEGLSLDRLRTECVNRRLPSNHSDRAGMIQSILDYEAQRLNTINQNINTHRPNDTLGQMLLDAMQRTNTPTLNERTLRVANREQEEDDDEDLTEDEAEQVHQIMQDNNASREQAIVYLRLNDGINVEDIYEEAASRWQGIPATRRASTGLSEYRGRELLLLRAVGRHLSQSNGGLVDHVEWERRNDRRSYRVTVVMDIPYDRMEDFHSFENDGAATLDQVIDMERYRDRNNTEILENLVMHIGNLPDRMQAELMRRLSKSDDYLFQWLNAALDDRVRHVRGPESGKPRNRGNMKQAGRRRLNLRHKSRKNNT